MIEVLAGAADPKFLTLVDALWLLELFYSVLLQRLTTLDVLSPQGPRRYSRQHANDALSVVVHRLPRSKSAAEMLVGC